MVAMAYPVHALTISGVVTDPDGAAVEGARVWAVQDRTPMVDTTGENGAFSFEGIRVGSADFVAYAEGFGLGGLAVRAVGDAEITLMLTEPATLGVQVASAAFEPIAGARLLGMTVNAAYRVAVDDLRDQGFPSLRSGDDGHLDIPWMPANGFAQIEVDHHRYARAFVPYLSVGSGRQTVVLRDGEVVRGRVLSPGDDPVPGARVSIFAQTGSGPLEVAQPITASDGFYNARVREGEYFVVARHPDYAGAPPMPLTVSSFDGGLVAPIQLRPPASVRGRIVLEDGEPAVAVRVSFLAHQTVYSDSITDREGVFVMDASPEPGALQIAAPRGYYWPDGPLFAVTPAEAETMDAGEFELAPLPLIQGRVVDRTGEPVPHAILSTYDLPTPVHTVADDEGVFALTLAFAPEHNTVRFRVEHPTRFERVLFEADLAEREEQTVQLAQYEPDMALEREGWTAPNNLGGLVDRPAPALTVGEWFTSEPLDAASLRGKVVVLTFWGGFAETGATPDRIAEMSALHAAMPTDEVVFIALHDSASLPEDVLGYIADYGLAFPVAQDSELGETFSAFGVTVIPQTVLIDRAGKVRHYDVDGRLPELIKVLLR